MPHLMMTMVCLLLGGVVLQAQEDLSTRPALWDLEALQAIKARAQAKDATVAPALARLERMAEKNLGKPFESVIDKVSTGGVKDGQDPHDYRSVSIYFWPDPKDPAAPWIRRDAEKNQEAVERYDSERLRRSTDRIRDAALAWWFTGREDFGRDAAGQLRHWFLNPETRMNPNLRYAQFVPNARQEEGRPSGLIDTMRLVETLSAVALLEQGPFLEPGERQALRDWVREYREWFLTSDLGRAEARAGNNHALYYDLQVVAFSWCLNDRESVTRVLQEVGPTRIAKQIEPDGRMPKELERPIAFTYTCWALTPLVQMAAMERNAGLGTGIWAWQSPDGRSLPTACSWVMGFVRGGTWTWGRASDPVRPQAVAPIIWMAVHSGVAPDWSHHLADLPLAKDDCARLLYGPRPATAAKPH